VHLGPLFFRVRVVALAARRTFCGVQAVQEHMPPGMRPAAIHPRETKHDDLGGQYQVGIAVDGA